jgi:uncharacterized damage-inducible protein DinB
MPAEPDRDGSESELLEQYLDVQREIILRKTEGLDRAQLSHRLPSSSLTLAGLLYHLSLAEEDWMQIHFAGGADSAPFAHADWESDPDWQFRPPADLDPEALRERYRDACEQSRSVVRSASDLGQWSAKEVRGERFTLRWALLHLIEETARHAGHADLLREAVDGEVG